MSELPNNWIETALANLAMIEMGQSPDSRSYNAEGKGLPFFQGKAEFQAVFPEIRKWCSEPTKVVERGDILLSIRAPVGPTNIAPEKSCIGRGLAGIRGEAGINQSYLYYFFKNIEPWLSEQGTGSTFAAISGQFVREISCPLAPAAEQTRIVEKLEELLSDLDAGVAELKAAQKKLAQYRQSLLKAAVEGALTAEWREARRNSPSPQPLSRQGRGAMATDVLNDTGMLTPLPPRGGGVGGEGAKARQVTSAIQQQHARELRSHQTPTERDLWQQLRAKRFAGFKFRRQQPLGRYIVDFVCFEQRLIVELDGSQHADQQDYDAERDAWLQAQGFRVLRFWNNQWSAQPEAVLEAIWLGLQQEPPLPNPSPARGEGLETGAQLLERILIERRARWEAKQLAKFKAQGKAPPKDWQKKYPEPVQPDTTDLPELPEGWVWASVDQLSESVRNGLSKTPNTNQRGFPLFKINAVRPMSVNFDAIKHIEIDESEAADYWVEVGDVLATRYNGSVDLLGVFGMVKDVPVRTLHPDKLICMKPVTGVQLGAWMEVCGNVGLSRKHLVSRVKTTAGQTGISGDDLKKTPIPLPPVAEQEVALADLDKRLRSVIELEQPTEFGLKQSAAQRQNILRAAFSGQLVPQDPNDEPASVLLERIRAERAERNAVKRPRGRKTKEMT